MYSKEELKSLEAIGLSLEIMEKQLKSSAMHDLLMQSFSKEEILQTEDYPDSYGGSYINDDGTFVVYTTELSEKNEKRIKNIIKSDEVSIKHAINSYKLLSETMDFLNDFLSKNPDIELYKNITAYGLCDKENHVFVELKDYNAKQIQLFKEHVLDSPVLKFKQGIEHNAELNANPGAQVLRPNGGQSSFGYRARSGSQNGIMMSGHATVMNENVRIGATTIGRVIARQRSGNVDAAFVATNAGVNPTRNVQGTNITLGTGVATAALGATVFQRGISTGLTSGTVVSTNVSVNVDNVPMTGLVRATYHSARGDSGGPVFSSAAARQVLGIHVASNGHYCRVQNVNNAFRTTMF